MSAMSDEELLAALGVEVAPLKSPTRTPREERIIAGFEDILRFHQSHGRAPQHGEDRDIFERLYAVRLDQLRKLPEASTLLAELDRPGLLVEQAIQLDLDTLDADALLAELGKGQPPADDDIRQLRHVRSSAEKRATEAQVSQSPCANFEEFKPLFEQVEQQLKAGLRHSKLFEGDTRIQLGSFFILDGLLTYVAEMSEAFEHLGRSDARLRVIYANGTESNLFLSSWQRTLSGLRDKPKARRITELDHGSLFANQPEPEPGLLFGDSAEPDDIESGTIYVLRSDSSQPFVVEHRELIHKIGVTGGSVEQRLAGAKKEATYLLADVEIVATYKVHNLNRRKLEKIFHSLFSAVQLDLTLEDRFGFAVKPREWFLVPLSVIDEAVTRILDGTITQCIYDPASARLVARSGL